MLSSKMLLLSCPSDPNTWVTTCLAAQNPKDGGFTCYEFTPPVCIIRGENWGEVSVYGYWATSGVYFTNSTFTGTLLVYPTYLDDGSEEFGPYKYKYTNGKLNSMIPVWMLTKDGNYRLRLVIDDNA